MFRTKYERIRVESNPGSNIKVKRAGEYDAKHNIVVKPVGKEDLYSEINSYANSVNIHVLLNRFKNGDKEALFQRAGAYIDISAMPTNLNDFVALYKSGENFFKTLPAEIKAKFNNNMIEFISKIGEPEWKEIMSVSPAQIKQEAIEKDKKVEKAHKEAAKEQFDNTVYGDNYSSPAENKSSGVRGGVKDAL